MSKSTFLDSLSAEERMKLIERLLTRQGDRSYISGKEIDLRIDQVEVDHIIARDRGGDDDESNMGLVIASETPSKGKRDLQLMRYVTYDKAINISLDR
jgi:CRISPR/Cas system Type II protein with McrA/HNH and RuvC-like nuclease domain